MHLHVLPGESRRKDGLRTGKTRRQSDAGGCSMKWTKLGKLFDPKDHALPNGCVEFSQSPQALVCEDSIRVYFSTRQRDASGKYLSHVAFVDFDKRLSRILD